MIDWLKNLISSDGDAATSAMDQNLLKELRRTLRGCESLYLEGAQTCAELCPDDLPEGPEKFAELMIDLHRGLIVKIFVEVAKCDEEWDPEERAAAFVVLKHVWSIDVDPQQISEGLHKATELAESLHWESLVGPFVRLAPLADQRTALLTYVTRIANIIAKADGTITSDEVETLRSLNRSVQNALKKSNRRTNVTSSTTDFEQATEAVSQIIPKKKRRRPPASGMTGSDDESGSEIPVSHTSKPREERLKEAMNELDVLVGLADVRKDLTELISFLRVQVEREKQNLPRTQVSLHTVFEGNPGTGKTTVARILGKALGGLGIVKKGHTVETDRSGLVAKFAGQTGPRVNERVDEALDGVLFVDEAYSLVSRHSEDQYGDEAIQVLLKRMEDDRHRLVVVIAGYPEPMSQMLKSNPGLSSRFQRTFHFPDYSVEELVEVFERMCRKDHYVLSTPAVEKLKSLFQKCVREKDEHFGNARLARNLFESSIRRLANRIVGTVPLTREILTTMTDDDIVIDNERSS